MSHEVAFRHIGVIHSPHTDPARTPVQPVFSHGVRGTVELFSAYAEGLRDLEGFSHIYLFYWFHRSAETKLLVQPYLDNSLRGVFATRATPRPNKLGMSVVRLLSVKGAVLEIDEVDILDQTPLLDIKPYVARFDTRTHVRSGWQDQVSDEQAQQRGKNNYPGCT
jgi:tRNA-Thr(GGU) m(6)t(6)A37 methyltransferase TsaA